jgi:hypothetical protein
MDAMKAFELVTMELALARKLLQAAENSAPDPQDTDSTVKALQEARRALDAARWFLAKARPAEPEPTPILNELLHLEADWQRRLSAESPGPAGVNTA